MLQLCGGCSFTLLFVLGDTQQRMVVADVEVRTLDTTMCHELSQSLEFYHESLSGLNSACATLDECNKS